MSLDRKKFSDMIIIDTHNFFRFTYPSRWHTFIPAPIQKIYQNLRKNLKNSQKHLKTLEKLTKTLTFQKFNI